MNYWKTILLMAFTALLSGCMCCGGFGPGGDDGYEDVDAGSQCSPPYMVFGSGCCLDANVNSICDDDEMTTTLMKETTIKTQTTVRVETTANDATTTTMMEPATTIMEATTTTIAGKTPVQLCVEKAGYKSDTLIYVYSNRCGVTEKTKLTNDGFRKGREYQYIDIGILSDQEKEVLACFYGPYYKGNMKYSMCPMLLCPTTGAHEAHTGYSSITVMAARMIRDCFGE
ncbi:MAG: hypothetical protein ABIH11_01145 [Candidatus Altiarchaeota archaeon]